MASLLSGCNSSRSTKVAPEENLISMIKAFEKDDELLKFLKKHPKSLFDADGDDKTVLMWAVEKGRDCIVKAALDGGINAENVDNDGWSAMMYAARRGNMEVLQMLLGYGVELNRSSTEDGFTALHLAAGNELIDVCIMLLKAGADPHIKDVSGKKPEAYIKDKRKLEKYKECCSDTFKEGITPDRLHQERQDLSVDKSLNKVMDLINKTAIHDVNTLIKGMDELNGPSVMEPDQPVAPASTDSA
jgi:ankyrin repeat protein